MARKTRRKAPRRNNLDQRMEDFGEEVESLGKRIEKAEIKRSMVAMKRGTNKRLYRSGRDKILGGVCGGIAEYLRIDPVVIRLLWVVAALTWGSGVLAYIIAWIIIPRNPRHKWD
jgi:phage shock protein C